MCIFRVTYCQRHFLFSTMLDNTHMHTHIQIQYWDFLTYILDNSHCTMHYHCTWTVTKAYL